MPCIVKGLWIGQEKTTPRSQSPMTNTQLYKIEHRQQNGDLASELRRTRLKSCPGYWLGDLGRVTPSSSMLGKGANLNRWWKFTHQEVLYINEITDLASLKSNVLASQDITFPMPLVLFENGEQTANVSEITHPVHIK